MNRRTISTSGPLKAFEQVLKEYEGCIILVSHDREFVQNICDRFLMIDRHKLKSVSTVDEYLSRNQSYTGSVGNDDARVSFQERRRLSNKKSRSLKSCNNWMLKKKLCPIVWKRFMQEWGFTLVITRGFKNFRTLLNQAEERILRFLKKERS